MIKRTAKKIKVVLPKFLELKGFLSFFILHDLKSGPKSGDDLALSIGKRKGIKLTPGTIYPALKRLKKQKLLIYRREGRKKIYQLTSSGVRELDAFYGLLGSYFIGLRSKIK